MSYRTHAILAGLTIVAVLAGVYWLKQRDPASAGSSASGAQAQAKDELYVPTPLPPEPVGGPLWKKELGDGVLAFRWTEQIGGEGVDHHGGILFALRDGRVYSRAWFNDATYAQPWPAVEGIGAVAYNTLSIAFRSSSYEPEHEFYYADCHFGISPDGKLFRCHFRQLADPLGDGTLTPGEASGVRVDKLDETFQVQLEELWAFVERIRVAEAVPHGMPHCMVLSHKHANPSIQATYDGKTYSFCCEACMKVFLADPKPFIEAHEQSMREPAP